MRIIRTEQLWLLGAPKRELFETRLAADLVERFPDHCASLGTDGLSAFVRRSVEKSVKHGITSSGSVTRFAGLLLQFGESFEYLPDNSEAVSILEDQEFPGQLKVYLLEECVNQATGGRRLLPAE